MNPFVRIESCDSMDTNFFPLFANNIGPPLPSCLLRCSHRGGSGVAQEGLRWHPGAGSPSPDEAKKCHVPVVCERVGATMTFGNRLVGGLEEGRKRGPLSQWL